MKQEDLLRLGASFVAGGMTTYVALKYVLPKVFFTMFFKRNKFRQEFACLT